MARVKAALARMGLITASLAAAVLVSEGLMRLAAPYFGLVEPYYLFIGREWYDKQVIAPDEVFYYRWAPNTTFAFDGPEFQTKYTTNRFGFRGTAFDQCGDRQRIFLIGDSMVAAPHMSDGLTAADVLQALLTKADLPYCVNNLGVSSYAGVQYFNEVRVYGEQWRPAIVVVALFHNDFFTDVGFDGLPKATHDNAGLVVATSPIALQNFPTVDGFERWYVYWFLNRSLETIQIATGRKPPPAVYPFGSELFKPGAETVMDVTFRHMAAAAKLVEGWGGRFLLSAFPIPNQVGPGQINLGYHSTGVITADFEPRRDFPDNVARKASQYGVEYFDMLSPLRARAQAGARLFLKIDGHLGVEGNREFGQLLFKELSGRGLLRKRP